MSLPMIFWASSLLNSSFLPHKTIQNPDYLFLLTCQFGVVYTRVVVGIVAIMSLVKKNGLFKSCQIDSISARPILVQMTIPMLCCWLE